MVTFALLFAMQSVPPGVPPQLGVWKCRGRSIEADEVRRLRLRIALQWNLPTPPGQMEAVATVRRSSSSDYLPGTYPTRYEGTAIDEGVPAHPWFEIYMLNRAQDRGYRIGMSHFDHQAGTAEFQAGPVFTSGDVSGPMMAFRGRCERVE